jgi:peptide/nickel transport system permease protein
MIRMTQEGMPTESLEKTKIYDEENQQWINILAGTQIIAGVIAIASGLLLLFITIFDIVTGTIGQGALLIVFLITFLPMAIVGGFLVNIGTAVHNIEHWSFPWVIYGNLIMMALYLLAGGIFTTFAIINLIPFLILFTPQIRLHWWNLFVEDTKPRIKETRYSLYLIRKSPLVLIGVIIIAIYVIMAIFAPFLVHFGTSPYIIPRHYDSVLRPPNSVYWFGTDYLGSDIYSGVIWGAQIDLKIAVAVVGVALIIGSLLGAVAGYTGGWLDEALMRVTDVFFAFPGLILAMAVVAALGGRSLENVSIALMIVWWPTYARLVRGQVLLEREKLYVEAARSVGANDARILLFHILPNTIQPVIVQATLDMGGVLLTAAGLSFIGYGAEPGTAEWGLMIAVGQRNFEDWWVTVFPGLAILFCALAFNLVGDGVRDIMDPKLRRRT